MDVFTSLSHRTKVLIVASSLFLLSLSVGLLVFGSNMVSSENELLDQAKNATRADMLYVQPSDEGH